jgi:hypothetical protein
MRSLQKVHASGVCPSSPGQRSSTETTETSVTVDSIRARIARQKAQLAGAIRLDEASAKGETRETMKLYMLVGIVVLLAAIFVFWSPQSACAQFFNGFNVQIVTFLNLGAPANSAIFYCSNCTVTSGIDNTCAGAGTGAMAFRIDGAWKCTI